MGWAFFLLISGAIIAHFAAISGQALLSLTWLLGLSLFGLRSLSWRARCLACLAIVGLVWVTGTAHAFYLPPILINVLLLVIFSMTLLPGRKPLIHSFAEHARGELEPRVADYTRRVTQAWVLFFAAMLIEMILLALFAPIRVWSLFANLFNYLFIVLFFLLEYGFRRCYLSDIQHPNFLDYLRFLKNTCFHTIARQ